MKMILKVNTESGEIWSLSATIHITTRTLITWIS